MTIFKIFGIVTICLIASVILKSLRYEYVYLTVIMAVTVIFSVIFTSGIKETISVIAELSKNSIISDYITVLFKALGISYLAVITAGMCRNAGEESLAKLSETAGKFEILALCIPLATDLIEITRGLV